MAVGAFIQVQQSLRWFIDNFSTIADWRATLHRVAGFRETVINMDRVGATASHIDFVKAPGNQVTFENLEIATPTGSVMVSEPHVEIGPGERVLIAGAEGVGRTILFRAIAGLWPWGSGRVALPSSEGVMFIPSRPYVPLGTLRAALTYPCAERAFKDEELVAALQGSGLNRLSSSLEQAARWEKRLLDEEQQCLILARILLHKPRFLVTDGTLDGLEEEVRKILMNLLQNALKDTAIINIGHRDTGNHWFTRVLYLVKDPNGRSFKPDFSVDLSSGG